MNTSSKISFGELLTISWALFKRHIIVLVGVVFMYLLVVLGIFLLTSLMGNSGASGSYILTIIEYFFAAYVNLIFLRVFLKVIDNEDFKAEIKFTDVLPSMAATTSLVAYNLLFYFLILIGVRYFIGDDISENPQSLLQHAQNLSTENTIGLSIFSLFIFYFYIRLAFVSYIIADSGIGFINAVLLSYKMTGKKFFKTFTLLLLFSLISVLGVIFFLFGIFVSLAFAYLFLAIAYRNYLQEYSEVEIQTL